MQPNDYFIDQNLLDSMLIITCSGRRNEKTDIQRASEVWSEKDLIEHACDKLSAAFLKYAF